MLSILNLVVDHVMVPPTPLEPDEFQWKLQQQLRQKQVNHFDEKEALDKQQEQNQAEEEEEVFVPVLRIFGPITHYNPPPHFTSGASSSSKRQQYSSHQSACLHIHGAYPYLLARPLFAGPDGAFSLFQNPSESNQSQTSGIQHRIDWDDEASVESILDEVQMQLESLLHTTFIAENSNAANQSKRKRFIRQVTIVKGRGFYTYCAGPPAPYCRVEYYDPTFRWKIKILLERGLDLSFCHDDRNTGNADTEMMDLNAMDTENRDGGKVGDNDEINMNRNITKFRCYEAHIPYTMQFFKDWNLAGMSNIKIGDGRFRLPLSKSVRSKIKRDGDEGGDDLSNLILERTVPESLLWKEEQPQERQRRCVRETHRDGNGIIAEGSTACKTKDSDNGKTLAQEKINAATESSSSPLNTDTLHQNPTGALDDGTVPSSYSDEDVNSRQSTESNDVDIQDDYALRMMMSKEDQYWTRKETSCDVELDTTGE